MVKPEGFKFDPIQDLIAKFPDVRCFNTLIPCGGQRYIYECGEEQIVKCYEDYAGYEANLVECIVSYYCDEQDRKFINSVTNASIINRKIVIAAPRCETPVTLKQLELSELYSHLVADEFLLDEEILSFIFKGTSVEIEDICMNDKGEFDNLGINDKGEVVIIDFGRASLYIHGIEYESDYIDTGE